jgi:hypothetical protein
VEVALDKLRLALRAVQIGAHASDHLDLVGGALAAEGVALDVLVEELVGVQLRGEGRGLGAQELNEASNMPV